MSDYRTGSYTFSVTVSNITQINTLLYGYKWGGVLGTGASLSFSFPWTTNSLAYWQSNYSPSDEPNATSHFGFNSAQSDIARTALQRWADIAHLTFSEIEENGNEVGDIRFAFSSDVTDVGFSGWSYYPDNYWACGGDVWISPTVANYPLDAAAINLLVHELGHALGLKHPGNYSGSEEGPFLSSDVDNQLYSIMSYNDPKNNWWFDTLINDWVYVYAESPMIYDIETMQYLYGANTAYHASDDIYTFDERSPFRITLWDAGGDDTISVANSSRGSLIDLNQGAFSSIQTTRFYSEFGIGDTYDGSYNLSIAYGAVIENATGGSGGDTLIGNDITNTLVGNAGDDNMDGNGGHDLLYGGNGNDTYTYSLGDGVDTIIDAQMSLVTINKSHGFRNHISKKHNYIGSDTIDFGYEISMLDIDAQRDADDLIIGIRSQETISTNLNDLPDQINLIDFFTFHGSVKTIRFSNDTTLDISSWRIGTADNDVLFANGYLFGGDGNDILYSSSQHDTLRGGNGKDTFVFDTVLNESTNIDVITDFVSIDDSFKIENSIFTSFIYTGEMRDSNFTANNSGTALDPDDYIIYNTTTGGVFYDADGNGAGAAVQFVTLTGLSIIASSNFFVS